MSETPDLNDRARAGELVTVNLLDGAQPINEAARRKLEQTPRVLTEQQLIKRSYDRAVSHEDRKSCTSIHWRIDFATGGMRPGHVWVFGAETNWGKTTYAVAVVDENIHDGKRALIVSSEDDESLYGDRLLARRAKAELDSKGIKFSAARMRAGRMSVDELDAITAVTAKAQDKPVFLDARGKSIENICRQANALVHGENIDLIVFDYLQEFRSEFQYKDERVKFRDIASQMRGVIKSNSITGIILSQITVMEGKKYPDKHSIRESRDVSNAAEVVALGFTPVQNIMKADGSDVLVNAGARCIKIDKAKDGRKVTVEVDWDEFAATFCRTRAHHDPLIQDAQFDDMFDNYRST